MVSKPTALTDVQITENQPTTRQKKGRRLDGKQTKKLALYAFHDKLHCSYNECPRWQKAHTAQSRTIAVSLTGAGDGVSHLTPMTTQSKQLSSIIIIIIIITAYLQMSGSRGAVLSAPPSLDSQLDTVIQTCTRCCWATSTSLVISLLRRPAPPVGLDASDLLLVLCASLLESTHPFKQTTIYRLNRW